MQRARARSPPSLGDLPLTAVQRVQQQARGTRIAGTNRYAAVCRQWREASSNDDFEPMPLFMDLSLMSEGDQDRASSWMAMHGQHVEVLFIAASQMPGQLLMDWFCQPAAALTCLKRLEVDHPHSLALLAPLLGQLPELEHLTAWLSMRANDSGQSGEQGVFQDGAGHDWEPPHGIPPDLQQLCPQLVHLHLTLHSENFSPLTTRLDERLPVLLPARLQQLALVAANAECSVLYHSLRHLTVLQQLTLDGVRVEGSEEDVSGSQLVALQQLRIYTRTHDSHFFASPFVQPKVTACECVDGAVSAHPGVIASMAQLTSLKLVGGWESAGGMAEVLAPLTGLHELSHCGNCAVPIVQQAAGMAQLRSLHLGGLTADPTEMGDVLKRCTQLTSLVLLVMSYAFTGNFQSDMHSISVSHMPVPQQLMGLRRLTIHQDMLLEGGGGWLAALTQLTCLHVMVARSANVKEQLQQVVGWPASLVQLVLWVQPQAAISEAAPRCWTFIPPGADSQQITVWFEQSSPSRWGTAPGWARPFRPCPHLPGVWQLQGEVEGLKLDWS